MDSRVPTKTFGQLLYWLVKHVNSRVPTETFGQLLRADARVAVLQLVENALQRKRDAVLWILSVRGVHVVNSLQTRAVGVSGPRSTGAIFCSVAPSESRECASASGATSSCSK